MDIKAGSTDQSVSFAAFTTATGAAVTVTSATAGLSLWYRRGTAGAKTAIGPSDLSALTDAHSDGGILVIGGQDHRLDLPDAAVAAGVDRIEWGGEATGITIDGGSANLIGQATTGKIQDTAQSGDAFARIGAAGAGLTALGDTRLANLDATISSRHASGAAVAKSPATLDWDADVSSKPTIGTSTLTQEQSEAAAAAAIADAGLDDAADQVAEIYGMTEDV